MPRRGSFNARNQGDGRSSRFAMQVPRQSAQVTSAQTRRVKDLEAPLGAIDAWQRDAFSFYDIIGEVAYVLNLKADTVSRCEFRPVKRDEEISQTGWRETDDPKVSRVWEAFTGPHGSKAELYRRAALLLEVVGEAYLIGEPLRDRYNVYSGLSWEFLSPEEVKVQNNGRTIKRDRGGYGGQQAEDLHPETYIARLHRSDPRYSDRPDCALRHVLPICRELVVLTQVVDAVAKSRISAGLLYVPDEMSFGPYNEMEDDADTQDEIDPFTEELIEFLIAPVEDRSSASSVVPLIIRGPAEFADRIKNVDLSRPLDDAYRELRDETIVRLAAGLSVPPEVLSGKGGLNDWTGYAVDSDLIEKHVKPLGEWIANFLTTSYLRPMLVQYEGMSEEEAANYRILFDASQITAHADAGPNARAAWDRKVLSDITYLRENGFDESDMPTEDELKTRDLRALMEAEPVIFGPQIIGMLYPELEGVIEVPGLDTVDTEKPQNPRNLDPGSPTDLPERKNHTGPKAGPVIDQDTGHDAPIPRGPDGPRMEESIIDRLATSADAALIRALEKAGNRLLSSMNGHKEMRAQFTNTPPRLIPSVVGPGNLRTLKTDQSLLFEGAWGEFADRAHNWLVSHYLSTGHEEAAAHEKAKIVVSQLVFELHSASVSALAREPKEDESGLLISPDVIRTAMMVADERIA